MEVLQYFDQMPPGIIFSPTDTQLILSYLRPKLLEEPLPRNIIHNDVQVFTMEPTTLSQTFRPFMVSEWYFFTTRPHGRRTRRSCPNGYWQSNGGTKKVRNEHGVVVGHKLTFNHHTAGLKTGWTLQEFSAEPDNEQVLCKLYMRGGVANPPEAPVLQVQPAADAEDPPAQADDVLAEDPPAQADDVLDLELRL